LAGKGHRSTPLRVLKPAERAPAEWGERFIGRERELGEIRAAMDGASSGRGRLLLFSGEPGIGKTRLADEAGASAVLRGMRVVWGRCWEGGGAPPTGHGFRSSAA